MAKRKKKDQITVKIDKLLGSFRMPISKTGGPMKASKGKGVSYNRKKQKKSWRKEHNL